MPEELARRVRQAIGDLVVQNLMLSTQLDAARAEIARLKEPMPVGPSEGEHAGNSNSAGQGE